MRHGCRRCICRRCVRLSQRMCSHAHRRLSKHASKRGKPAGQALGGGDAAEDARAVAATSLVLYLPLEAQGLAAGRHLEERVHKPRPERRGAPGPAGKVPVVLSDSPPDAVCDADVGPRRVGLGLQDVHKARARDAPGGLRGILARGFLARVFLMRGFLARVLGHLCVCK